MKFNPILTVDSYKLGHVHQYPEGTEFVYSNLTARGSRIPSVKGTVFFGLQAWMVDFLIEEFNDGFFRRDVDLVCNEYQRRVDNLLGPDNGVGTDHIRALHELGYLPIEIRAVDEGTVVPLRVPMLTIENTLPEFAWVTNHLETVLSNALWMPITSATTAHRMHGLLMRYAERTGDPDFVQFQSHDFSMRGMSSVEAAAMSGAGHLLSFVGTDSLTAIELLEQYYDAVHYLGMVGVSVPATEHSVMCAGGFEDEAETYSRLMDRQPSGILSVVSDTWDIWNVLTNILPAQREQIMSRDGKLVIRPDSGDPVDIICGTMVPRSVGMQHDYPARMRTEGERKSPEERGVIQLLWDEFGGTVNDKGYKVLDPHVGVIYGDAITYDRAEAIMQRLEHYGFASTNIVFGVGSYTYQFVTRDTFAMAVKATWVQIDGEGHDIFKNPITDDGTKKSATGRLAVIDTTDGITLVENPDEFVEQTSLLKVRFRNGRLTRLQSLEEIRTKLASQ